MSYFYMYEWPNDLMAHGSNDKVRKWSLDLSHSGPRAYTFTPGKHISLSSFSDIQAYPYMTAASHGTIPRPNFKLPPDGWIRDLAYNPPHLLLWVPPASRGDIRLVTNYKKSDGGKLEYSSIRDMVLPDTGRFVHGSRLVDCFHYPK